MTTLNGAGQAYARSLIASGAVDKTAAWSFTADDGNALLGAKGDGWENYGKHHLGVDAAQSDKTKAHWKYPFAKGGKLYRSGLVAIRDRAAQQKDTSIFDAAGELLAKIDNAKTRDSGFETKFAPFEVKFSNDAPGTFSGYGSVFGNIDDGGDMIMPGAFAKTLRESALSGRMPRMFVNHAGMPFGTTTANDLIPVGVWTKMAEDSKGLAVEGRLINLDTERGKSIHGAMKEGAIDGLSIGYKATNFTRGTKATDPLRTINEAKLFEVSLVALPMNEKALISSVKSQSEISPSFCEQVLRDAGLPRRFATALVAVGFKAASNRRDADDAAELVRQIEAGTKKLNSLLKGKPKER